MYVMFMLSRLSMLIDTHCQPDDIVAGLGGVGQEAEEFQEGPIGSAIREQKVHLYNFMIMPSLVLTPTAGIPQPYQCPHH